MNYASLKIICSNMTKVHNQWMSLWLSGWHIYQNSFAFNNIYCWDMVLSFNKNKISLPLVSLKVHLLLQNVIAEKVMMIEYCVTISNILRNNEFVLYSEAYCIVSLIKSTG